jgi:DNA primase
LIPADTIEKIKDAARIEEVVGDFVALRKRGINQIGLCPFHNEKTPSFTVSPSKGIYKCFGCGEAGSSIDFVMKVEHYTYPQALKYLADKYHIELEEEEFSPEQKKAQEKKESLYGVTLFAQKHFTDRLHNHDEGKAIGLTYFHERGFSEEIIDRFQLGYSLESWDDFYSSAKDAGYQNEYLNEAGLAVIKDDGKAYDRFRARVIFPIHNLSGRPIGFGGRILSDDKKKPKYVNSPESEIYHKSNVLYGIFQAKNSIIKQDNCYLVEGYTDVISLVQSGIDNVVASSGTSLTIGQIKLIKRFTPNITILYDGDAAGIKASFRGIDLIVEQGMNVRIVQFPQGEDPDSFAQQHTSSELAEFLANAQKDFIGFKTQMLAQDAGNDPVRRAEMVRNIVDTIALIPDAIKRNAFLQATSQQLDMPEQVLHNEINKLRQKKFQSDDRFVPPPEDLFAPPKAEKQEVDSKPSNLELQERNVIRLLLNYGNENILLSLSKMIELEAEERENEESYNVSAFIIDEILVDEIKFINPVFQQIFDIYVEALDREDLPDEAFFINHENDEVRRVSIDLLAEKYELSHNWKEKHQINVAAENDMDILAGTVVSAVYVLKSSGLEVQEKKINEVLKTNPEDFQDLLVQLKIIKNAINLLNRKMGRKIIH